MSRGAQRWLGVAGVVALLALAAVLRFAPIRAALPYTDYIDEGYALSQVIDHLNTRSMQCRWYGYPTMTSFMVTAAMRAVAPVYRAVHGHGFRDDLPRERERYLPAGLNYNLISPPELIMVGRVVVALISIGTVVIAGLLARLLGGTACGLVAVLFTAVAPALVVRSSNIIVDSVATFFVLLSLYFAARIARDAASDDTRFWRNAALAGVAAGLAASSKYTAGAVFAAVLVTIAMLPRATGQRVRAIALAGAAFSVAALCANPSFIQHPQTILSDMRNTTILYKTLQIPPGYWGAALSSRELGIPVVAAGLAGLGVMLRHRASRGIAIAWLAFAAVLLAPLLRLSFQPFRNVLPLVPPLCVAAAFLLAAAAPQLLAGRPAFRRLRVVPILVAAGIAFATGVSSAEQIGQRLARVDTRATAVNWLNARTTSEDSILAVAELVVLPSEWKRLKARVTVVPWLRALEALEREHFDYVVGSEMNISHTTEPEWAPHLDAWTRKVSTMAVAAAFGEVRDPVYPYLWRTNDLRVIIWKPETAARQAALSTAEPSIATVSGMTELAAPSAAPINTGSINPQHAKR